MPSKLKSAVGITNCSSQNSSYDCHSIGSSILNCIYFGDAGLTSIRFDYMAQDCVFERICGMSLDAECGEMETVTTFR